MSGKNNFSEVIAKAEERLFLDLTSIIQKTKSNVASSVNSALVLMYWQIGQKINAEILGNERAAYGKKIVVVLSVRLTVHHGKGFNFRSLFRMAQFQRLYQEEQIVSELATQLSWSHFIELIGIEDKNKRDFYSQMCRIERWGTKSLRTKIGNKLYERTVISGKPENVIKNEIENLRIGDVVSPDMVFQDPYVLDFLNLPSEFSEKQLENAILDEIVKFIRTLGSDFCFVDRQKRMSLGGEDFYLDLLFFHRRLCRLIAIDLKLERFAPSHKGQMEFYLRWLDKYEKRPNEESPIGMILCPDKKQETVDLFELNNSGIHVAQYITELEPLQHIEDKIKNIIVRAKNTLTE